MEKGSSLDQQAVDLQYSQFAVAVAFVAFVSAEEIFAAVAPSVLLSSVVECLL